MLDVRNRVTRIHVLVPDMLLEYIDNLAKEDYATRSAVIRDALWFYMRQPANNPLINQDELMKTLHWRKGRAYGNKELKNLDSYH